MPALRSVASIFSSSGCQSSVYFISNRRMFRLIGGPNVPLDVMIHPELPRDRVTCSRPTWIPLKRMLKVASPVAGVGRFC